MAFKDPSSLYISASFPLKIKWKKHKRYSGTTQPPKVALNNYERKSTLLFVLISENSISLTEALILISRDFSVVLYGIYLAWRGRLFDYQFRAIWCGKITTFLQFFTLFSLTLHYPPPPSLYWVFILLGILALGELYTTDKRQRKAF